MGGLPAAGRKHASGRNHRPAVTRPARDLGKKLQAMGAKLLALCGAIAGQLAVTVLFYWLRVRGMPGFGLDLVAFGLPTVAAGWVYWRILRSGRSAGSAAHRWLGAAPAAVAVAVAVAGLWAAMVVALNRWGS